MSEAQTAVRQKRKIFTGVMGANAVPCEKCVQRGCGSICPDGVLTPGRNGRLVLAGTEELHDRIDHCTSRIRELEGALQALQAQVSDEPHPSLLKESFEGLPPSAAPSRPSTSSFKAPATVPAQESTRPSPPPNAPAPMDADPAVITEFSGTLSVSGNGEASFFGPTARLEFLAHRTTQPDPKPSRLSHELFEFACEDHRIRTERLGNEIFQLRPTASEASRLCELYIQGGKVMYSPIPRSELIDDIFMPIYRAESFSDLQPETLALLFIVFAISTHFDPKKRTNNHDASEYYYLAKASLHLSSYRENTLAYIQSLIHMVQYLHFSGSTMPELQLEYLSRAIRIGYKMGLHLHGVRWDLSEDLAQKRSRMFCEIFLLDTWTSFYSGRPPMVSLAFVDRTTPRDYDEGVDADGNRKPGFHTWTYKYAILLHSIMAVAFGPRPPSYSTILDLDLKVRNFPVPVQWRPICEQDTQSIPPEIHMVRFLVSFAKESTLLNLHRSYFISALEESPVDLASHSFIPSVLAVYRSAWRLMRGLRFIWGVAPELVSKMNAAWSQALSAAVVMCLFVTRSPGSHLTDPALSELDLLVELFEEAVSTCRAASDLLNDLRSLRTHSRATAGHPYKNEGYAISPSHLDRLTGKTYLLVPPESGLTASTSRPSSTRHSTPATSHHQYPLPPQPMASSSHFSAPDIKRDPSPSRATLDTLSDFPFNSPFAVAEPLPIPSLHAAAGPAAPSHSLPSTSSESSPYHPHAHIPYVHSHPPSSTSHSHTPLSRTSVPGSSSSSSHLIARRTPTPTQQALALTRPPVQASSLTSTHGTLHPTILQDIHDFTMRGTPAASSAAHYFDFPPREDIDDASISVQIPPSPRQDIVSGAGTSGRAQPSAASDAGDTAGVSTVRQQRGHSLPGYPTHQYHTPTPTQPHAHSHSPVLHGHTSHSDYGFFQTIESSFHVDYAPQPRSPFTAATFGSVGVSGSMGGMGDSGVPNLAAMHASYQELVEHLGFH